MQRNADSQAPGDYAPELPKRTMVVPSLHETASGAGGPKETAGDTSKETDAAGEAPGGYFIAQNNSAKGPFTLEDLAMLARSGVLQPQSRVTMRGWEEWKTFAEVPELSALLAVVPARRPEPVPAEQPQRTQSVAVEAGVFDAGVVSRIQSQMEQIQAALLTLARDVETRTEGLLESQRRSSTTSVEGMQAVAASLEELRKSESSRRETLVQQLAEVELRLAQAVRQHSVQAQEEAKGAVAALREEWVAANRALAGQKDVQDLEARMEARLAELEARRREEADALGRRIEALQLQQEAAAQAATASAEALRAAFEEGLKARFEVLAAELKGQAESISKEVAAAAGEARSLAAPVEAVGVQLASVGSALGALARHVQVIEEGAGAAAKERAELAAAVETVRQAAAGHAESLTQRIGGLEDEERKRSDVFLQHFTKMEASWVERFRAVLEEIQATPGRLDARFTRLEQLEDEAFGQLTALRGLAEERLAWTSERVQQLVDAVAESRQSFETRLEAAEQTALERHGIFLAAADEARGLPDRLHKDIQATFKTAREDIEAMRRAVDDRVAHFAATLEASRQAAEGRFSASLDEERKRAAAEHASAWEQWRLRHDALATLVESLQTYAEKELGGRLARLEQSAEGGFSKMQAALGQMAAEAAGAEKRRAAESAQAAEASAKRFDELRADLRALQAESSKALAAQARAQEAAWAELSKTQSDAFTKLDEAAEARHAQQTKETAGLVESLGAAHEGFLQSLTNLGAWSETLHDQVDAAQTALTEAVAEFRASAESASARKFEQLSQTLAAVREEHMDRQQQMLQALKEVSDRLSVDLRTGLAATGEVSDRRFADLTAAMATGLQAGAAARAEDRSALLQAVEGVRQALLEGQKALSAELAAEEKKLHADLTAVRKLVDEVRAQGASRQDALLGALADQKGATEQQLGALRQAMNQELTEAWGKRWQVLAADLALMRDAASTRKQELARQIEEFESRLPGTIAGQVKPDLDGLLRRLGGLEVALAEQQKQAAAAREALTAQWSERLQSLVERVEGLHVRLKEDLAGSLSGKLDELEARVAQLHEQTPETRALLVQSIKDSVARMPDYLTESYRITNNELQKQITEMALEVSAAGQQVDRSRQLLDKLSAEQREAMAEAMEASRQEGATALREAKQEIQAFYGTLLEQLKSWQAEQSKVIALATAVARDSVKEPEKEELPPKPSVAGPVRAS